MKSKFNKILAIVIGELMCAIAITYFFVPHHLLSGGVGGLAIMIQYLTGYSSGIFFFLINLPLFFLGFKKLSKDFMIFTFMSSNLLSIYLMALKALNLGYFVDDVLLSAVFGGVLNGVGMGIMFKNGTSQGGLDVVAIIARQEYNLNVSSVLMAMNFVIVTIASILFGATRGMYTLMSMYIGYQCVDKVMNGLDEKKQIMIISQKSEEIAKKIMDDPHRGVTLFEARGAYTGEKKDVVYCVAYNRQVVKIKQILEEIDPSAFMSISDMVEVKGKGFIEQQF
ncbi:MAG: YitT family protein [Tissierellia bacterium]|nr:YitT family protein [Tissierellia bacterium]